MDPSPDPPPSPGGFFGWFRSWRRLYAAVLVTTIAFYLLLFWFSRAFGP